MKPLVSILIPAYNAEPWIGETLQSALDQTWERKEIIVVNDGSTDQTLASARRFEAAAVKVASQANQGASAARNTALGLCQGDFIQWLDADDLLARDKIERQMAVVDRGCGRRTLLSSAWGRFGFRVSKARFSPTALWRDLVPVEWLLGKLGQNLYMMNASWLVSRELTEAAGPWDTRLSTDDDGEYFCRVLLASDGVRFVPEAKAYYRQSSFGSLSHLGQSDRRLESQLLSMQRHIACLRSLEDSERTRQAGLQYLQTWLHWFYPERPHLVAQLEQLAATLGGRLEPPRLRWKYAWIRPLLGWTCAKRAQLLMPRLKHSLLRSWDKALYRLERRADGLRHG
jgi:glycosyltransferase involved in cell wall biosynthesis